MPTPFVRPGARAASAPARARSATRQIALIAAALVALLIATWLAFTDTASASLGGVSGHVYYDQNNDGVRQPSEPGIAGIVVRDNKGDQSAITASDGGYTFPHAPASGFLQIETGWFRSQCPPANDPRATSCGAGPGADNDFEVDNEFVRYALTKKAAAGVDAGLMPDWPGPSLTPPAPSGGVVAANTVDVAARLSWGYGNCAGGLYAICGAGDKFTLIGQLFNQGTTALTGLTARVYIPQGDCVKAIAIVPYTVPAGLGAMTQDPAEPTCATRYVTLTFAGRLTAAGGFRVTIDGKTTAGPGTPGCLPKRIDKALCPLTEPQSRGWLLGVSHIDQTGDPDSTFCAAGDMTTCPIGIHDKRREPDEIDPAGHTVSANLPGTSAYDLVAHASMAAGPDQGATTVRAWASNPGPGASPPGVTVSTWFPAGTKVIRVPARHNLIKCDNGKPGVTPAGVQAVVVTCLMGAPVAETLSSPAADITVAGPVTSAVICVAPPASRPAETIPAVPSCGLSTEPTKTTTNNDTTP